MNSANAQQKIGLKTAIMVGLNAMIGAGIFAVPFALSSCVGPAGILTYLFVIVAIWFMGDSLARLAQLYPQAGSLYNYGSQWGGHYMGLLSAGSYLIGLTIALGLLMQCAGDKLVSIAPAIPAYTYGILSLITLLALNIIGMRLNLIGQIILLVATLFPIIAITGLCLWLGNWHNLQPFMPYDVINIFAASKIVIFGFFGFEAISSLSQRVENPKVNVPRALMWSIALVGLFYTLFVASIFYALPTHILVTSTASEALKSLVPNHTWIVNFIDISIIAAILGTVHSMIWACSELLVAFFKQCAITISHRTAVLIIGAGTFATFTVLKGANLFFNLTAIFIIVSFVTSMIALLTLKSEWQSKRNIKTLIGLCTAAIIIYFALESIITGS